MLADLDVGTPQARLERSRKAIARQLAHRTDAQHAHDEVETFDDDALPPSGIWSAAKRAARAWWIRHPLHTAVDFARPALEDYALREPVKLIGIAAGAGAAVALLKYWRVLSIGGIAFAMLKSSDFSGTARTLVNPFSTDKD